MKIRVAVSACVLAAVLAGAVPAVAAKRPSPQKPDVTPPTVPTNVRITATTEDSISLAWNASTDNSGSIHHYVACYSGWLIPGAYCLWGSPVPPATTITGLVPGTEFSAAMLVALAPAQALASVVPLPDSTRAVLTKGGFWHAGCPVGLGDLRLLTVKHRGFDGLDHTGQLIVNKAAAGPLQRVWSMHAFGLAVDLNPVENPYVGCGQTRDPAATR